MTATGRRPQAWAVLELALAERRAVRVRYHGEHRVVCPHALGWKDSRAKVLAYQIAGTTSHGPLSPDPRQRWRSLFIDEIDEIFLTDTDQVWGTADNYAPHRSNGIDMIELAVPADGL